MSEESLQSILSNEAAPQPSATVETPVEQKTEAPAEKAEPAKSEPTRDEASGRFAKAEPDKSAKEPLKPADVAAIIDERRKRQEAEEKLRALTQSKPKTDIFENPELAIQERLDERLAPINERFFKMSMKAARKGREDFEEVASVFADAAEKDPQLWNAFRNSDDPGEYAYSIGIQLKELGDVGGDITKYREKVTSQASAENKSLKEQLAAMQVQLDAATKQQKELSEVPRSLNKSSSDPAPTLTDADPEDIKSIVRFGNKSR